jgi:hypothetical protein
VIIHVTDAGDVQLEELDGQAMEVLVNGSRLKLYKDKCPLVH